MDEEKAKLGKIAIQAVSLVARLGLLCDEADDAGAHLVSVPEIRKLIKEFDDKAYSREA